VRHPLASESLQFLDGVVRRMNEKGTDQVQPLVVRQMRCWFVGEWFPVQILCLSSAQPNPRDSLDLTDMRQKSGQNCGRDRQTHGRGIHNPVGIT
jgi:hypothetical protein